MVTWTHLLFRNDNDGWEARKKLVEGLSAEDDSVEFRTWLHKEILADAPQECWWVLELYGRKFSRVLGRRVEQDDYRRRGVMQLITQEWHEAYWANKAASSTGWQSRTNEQMRTMLYTSLAGDFPMWKRNTEIDAACPVDNSDDERWVSALNRIKSKLRSRLSDAVADDLLIISQNGPTPSNVDWNTILSIWRGMSERGRYSGVWKSDRVRLAEELQADYND